MTNTYQLSKSAVILTVGCGGSKALRCGVPNFIGKRGYKTQYLVSIPHFLRNILEWEGGGVWNPRNPPGSATALQSQIYR